MRHRISAGRQGKAPGIFVLVSAFLFAAYGTAFADFWYESYDKAEKAIQAENWTEAIRQINLALEKKGDSSQRARTYGMNFVPYFPYYKLGIAYFNLGQFDAALQAFETEVRLGAIVDAKKQRQELENFRTRIDQAKLDAAREEELRIEGLVAGNLSRAAELESGGDIEAALAAVDRALAVDQSNADAGQARDRILRSIADLQRQRQTAQSVATLIGQGEEQLEAGKFQEAAVTFSRALALEDSTATQLLLDRAQQGLRAKIETERSQSEREQAIATSIEQAGRLESEERFQDALQELQAAVALAPEDPQVLEMQTRILGLQRTRDQQRSQREFVDELLVKAEELFRTGDYEAAGAQASLAIAQDPTNQEAVAFIARAYREIGQEMLGSSGVTSLPPMISYAAARVRTELGRRSGESGGEVGGFEVELVRDPNFRLQGTIFHRSDVKLEFEEARTSSVDESEVEAVYDRVFVEDLGSRVDTTRALEGDVTTQPYGENILINFSVPRKLKPGLTIFRVIARDDQDRASNMKYAVLYKRPVHRSPWLYAGVAVFAVVIAGGLYTRSVRKRNELLKRRFNPYIAGAPVMKQDIFFGRDQLQERVLQSVHNNSILLYGERRIGKTSFQHHLKRRLLELNDPEYDFYPVYIDLQGTPEQKFFATLAEDMIQDLGPLLDGFQPHPSLHEEGAYQYRELVQDIRKVLKILDARSEKNVKLVLLIDEVDELNDYDPRVNQRLRSLFMKGFAENLAAVVSGVGIKKHWESEGSPWYNFFEEIEMRPFRREDAEKLIEKPIEGMFKLESGVVDSIIDKTGCKPYLIQKLCISLVNRLHEQKRRIITVADVEAVGPPKEA